MSQWTAPKNTERFFFFADRSAKTKKRDAQEVKTANKNEQKNEFARKRYIDKIINNEMKLQTNNVVYS